MANHSEVNDVVEELLVKTGEQIVAKGLTVHLEIEQEAER